MSAVASQSSLFVELDAAAGAESLDRRAIARRGRGATAVRRTVVELQERSAVGRHKLTFAYRPLKAWSEATLETVHGLLERYFARIGGFCIARDSTVRMWYEALASGLYTPDELRWAVDAKAASLAGETPAETREKRRFACGPGRFLQLAGYWLEQSPEYQAHVARVRAIDEDRAGARLAEARDAATRRELDDIKARVEGRSALREDQRVRAEARRAAVWGSLSPGQRVVALQATERAFRERCEQWGERPDNPDLGGVRTDFATNWALLKWPPATEPAGGSIPARM